MSPETHLHAETKIFPVKDRNALLSRQFLLGTYLERRPHHHMIASTPDLSCRSLKTTLAKKYGSDTSIHLPNGQLTLAEYRVGLAALHQKAVAAAIAENTSRVLLGGYPPPIAAAEACLASTNTINPVTTQIRILQPSTELPSACRTWDRRPQSTMQPESPRHEASFCDVFRDRPS